jgi:hypothetical protein
MVKYLFVVEVPHPCDRGTIALLPRPFARIVLCLGGGKHVAGVVFDHVILARRVLRPTLWNGLDLDVRHGWLQRKLPPGAETAGVLWRVPL